MQKVIILGQPNVGKSSLFNCILKERNAITAPIEGTTRDINIKSANIGDVQINICDTAGIVENNIGIFKDIKKRIMDFIDTDDIILYMVDSSKGIDDYDVKFFRSIKNSILVVNKIDINKHKTEEWEYNIFGTNDIFFISTTHNKGLQKLRNHIKFLITKNNIEFDLPQNITLDSTNKTQINIGIIGRVNVGKSSLLNALVGKDRSVVSDIEGTTIDPVDDKIVYNDKIFNFVDTAGIRRRSKIEGIEKYALERTNNILQQSDIVILVLDASKPFIELDEKISSLSNKHKLGIIVVFNKWDIKYAEFNHIQSEFKHKFAYLSYAPTLTVSALSKRHINDIKEMILKVYENFTRRIPTSLLNQTIQTAVQRHPIPSDKGKMVKIYYATQINENPPTIIIVMNKPNSLHFSYKRYLVNFLRKNFNFEGTPILILPRHKNRQNNLENVEENNLRF